MNSAEYPKLFQVIVNAEKCHSIWPVDAGLPVPTGWRAAGFIGPIDLALAQAADSWQTQLAAVEPDT